MSDSKVREHLTAMQERDRERRIEGIKRWVEYIESEPPETWGPQQNAVVDDQLEAAQSVRASATHHRRVKDVAADILEAGEESDGDS